jgi:hypothetical protein
MSNFELLFAFISVTKFFFTDIEYVQITRVSWRETGVIPAFQKGFSRYYTIYILV